MTGRGGNRRGEGTHGEINYQVGVFTQKTKKVEQTPRQTRAIIRGRKKGDELN